MLYTSSGWVCAQKDGGRRRATPPAAALEPWPTPSPHELLQLQSLVGKGEGTGHDLVLLGASLRGGSHIPVEEDIAWPR